MHNGTNANLELLNTTPRKRIWQIVSLLLVATVIYLSFRGVDWRRVWQVARSADITLLLLSCAVNSIAYGVRALRWQILLSASGPIRYSVVFWSNSSGYIANNFLPARPGEVLRSAMIAARSNLSKTYVLTTAISERMIDGLALMIISSIVLLTIPHKPAWLAAAARPFAILGLGGAASIAILPHCNRWLEAIIARLPLAVKWRDRLTGIVEQVVLGLRSFHSMSRLAGFIALTGAIWFLDATSSIILARALDLPVGFALAFLMLTGIGLSSAVPTTPGNLGVFQFVTVSLLTPFGIAHSDALAYGLIGQALNYVVVAFWGVLAVWRYNRD